VPYGPLSGITELTFSKLEATTQNISGENLAEGGGQTRVYTKVLNHQIYHGSTDINCVTIIGSQRWPN